MMKKLLLLFAILFMAADISAQDEYTIDGNIKGISQGTVISLYRRNGRLLNIVASDTIKSGESFHFKEKVANGKIDKLALIAIGDGFPQMPLNVYATPNARITINGADKYICTWDVQSTVKDQLESNKLIDCARQEWIEYQILSATRNQQQQNDDSVKEIQLEMESVMTKINKKQIALMFSASVTDVWIDALYKLSQKSNLEGDKFPYRNDLLMLYSRLNMNQRVTDIAKMIKINLYPPKVVKSGDIAVDGDLFDLDGTKHHLSQFKGKYILMDFWSCGCGPCVMSIPELKEIAEAEKDKLEVVSLSIDNMDSWIAASKRHDITWNNWRDNKQETGIYANYGVKGIPHYVLISPEGKVVASWFGYGEGSLKSKIRRWVYNETDETSQEGESK